MAIRFLPNDPLAVDVLPLAGAAAAAGAARARRPRSATRRRPRGPLRDRQHGVPVLAVPGSRAGRRWRRGGRSPPRPPPGRTASACCRSSTTPGPGLERPLRPRGRGSSSLRRPTPGRPTRRRARTPWPTRSGHALLDAVRPELWESVYTEPAAFHEAFADCMALLVGLFDAASRQALLRAAGCARRTSSRASPRTWPRASGPSTAPTDPQSLPRRALNTLQWEIPVNLPPFGPPRRAHAGGAQLRPGLHRLLLRHRLQHLRGAADARTSRRSSRPRRPRAGS